MSSRSNFPEQFGCIEDTRGVCQDFFRWYNIVHRHTGIGLLTPETLHYGLADKVRAALAAVLKAAYAAHPERFVRQMPVPPVVPGAAWINKPNSAFMSEEALR